MPMTPFSCVCGAAAQLAQIGPHQWARLTGYGSHFATQWHASRASACTAAPPFDLLAIRPAPQQQYWLKVAYPFVVQEQMPFWSLYEPPMVVWNGISQGEVEIGQMALAQCRLLSIDPIVGPYKEAQAVALVQVDAVVSFAELARDAVSTEPIAATVWDTLSANPPRHPETQIVSQGDYLFVDSVEAESDGGSWAIFFQSAGERFLLLFVEWGFHSDFFWAGKARLNANDKHRLDQLVQP